jgi:hypothetical protein
MKYIVLSCLILLQLLSSCKKGFLDLTDPTRLTTDKFYADEEQVRQAVNGIYSRLQEVTNNRWLFAELPSDNTTVHFDPSDRGQADRIEALEYWTVTPTNMPVTGMYNLYYSAIYNTNFALSRIGGATLADARKRQFEGELQFLRAFFYFDLVRYFGPVVLVTRPLTTPEEAYTFQRSAVAEVYTQIIQDLTEAAQKLPAKVEYGAQDKGRISKGAALALLGKVYLTTKEYQKAETALRQVTTMGYSLLSSYVEVFNPANKNHNESVFEVQYLGGNNLGEHSNFMYVFAPRGSAGAVVGFPQARPLGHNIPTRSIINAFEPNDSRKEVSLKEGYLNAQNTWVPVPFINKYNAPHTIIGRTDNNWPMLRYADVLLMLAEAINEQQGPTADAFSFLNAVRTRAGLGSLSNLSKDDFRRALLQERRVELAFENHRWFDLKRMLTAPEMVALLNSHGQEEKQNPTTTRAGVPFNTQDYMFQAHELVLPIPEAEARLNAKVTQNPGY